MRPEEAGAVRRCERARDRLPLVLLGEAVPGDEEFVRLHLQGCTSCREETERLRTLLGSLATTEVPDPGEAYWEAFLPRLRSRIAGKRLDVSFRWGVLWPALSAATAMLLLAGALVVGWQPRDGGPFRSVTEIAGRARPEEIREAFEKVYPGTEGALAIDRGIRALPSANQMQEALDVVLPADESDIYTTVRALPPDAQKWFVRASSRGAV
jgi:Putative zinc-finger